MKLNKSRGISSLILSLLLTFMVSVLHAQPSAPVLPSTTASNAVDVKKFAPDIARVVKRGELIVAMVAKDTPPFFYEKNGEMAGLDVDLAREIAKELKVQVKFNREAKSFNEVVDIVASGQADLAISKISRTLPRAKQVFFTSPYIVLKHALVVNRAAFARLALDRPATEVVRSFKGSIGVISGSAWVDFASRNFPKAKVVEFKTWDEAIQAVTAGQVTAAYRDEFEIRRLLRADPKTSLSLRTITLNDLQDTISIAANANDPVLLSFVNQYLEQRSNKVNIEGILSALDNM